MSYSIQSTKFFINKVYHRSRALIRKVLGFPIIYNANRTIEAESHKRALLVYLVKPFQIKDNDPRFLRHQNFKQCKQIAELLGEFAYIVDVADVSRKNINIQKDYDLIISNNPKLNDTNINVTKDAIKIYLPAGMNRVQYNKNVLNRYKQLFRRRGCELTIRRLIDENMSFVKKASFIIGFGDDYTKGTWEKDFSTEIFMFNNYGYSSTRFINKDYSSAKHNFLFFTSSNQVGRGLDLLLEIYPKHPELHLYICSSFQYEKDFCRCYHKELYETPNIHPIGKIKVNSAAFYEIIENCAYVILPSCAEGQSGSVIQCMYAGLIPVITKETGINVEEFGITFVNNSLEEIENTIVKLSNFPSTWHREHSEMTRKIAEQKYSEEAFIRNWREILSIILR